MKLALVSVSLCLFVSLYDCRSIKVKSESGDEIAKIEPLDYSVDTVRSADLSPKKRSIDLVDHGLVPVSEQAMERVKKSLTKNRMKRLTKPKYLEDKLREMVEQRPEMKSRIVSKLAERKSKKQTKNVETGMDFEQEQLRIDDIPAATDYNMYEAGAPIAQAAPAAPVYDYNMYEASAQITHTAPAGPVFDYNMYEAPAPIAPEAPVYDYNMYEASAQIAQTAPAAPVYDYNMYEASAQIAPEAQVAPAFDYSMYAAAAQLTPEIPADPSAFQVEQTGELYTGANPFALQTETPFGIFEQSDQEYEPSNLFSRSVCDHVDEELMTLQAFEVHPIETDIFETEILSNMEEAAKLLQVSFPREEQEDESLFVEPMPETEVDEISTESGFSFFQSEEEFDKEVFESRDALDENMKFKKDIPHAQFAQELFYNSLQQTPDYHFSSDYILESLPCAEHLWAPLEPVKTYEIKQVAVDKAAIIAEIKSVLGEATGPIIIGEPGEPVIVKHFAKPYLVEYFERPIVVEHHQTAALNIFESKPVVVDHFEPIAFNEVPAEPLVVVEEVCPCTGAESLALFS